MTRAEAVRMIVSICADHEVSDAIIAALTAAPEKPKVDVRKVFRGKEPGELARRDDVIAWLRAAGVEVVE